jgi:hypothetical protein
MDTPHAPYPGPDAHDATALLVAPPTLACTRCTAPLPGTYHLADGRVICSRCRATIEAQAAGPAGSGGFASALMRGAGVALACAVAYGAFMIFTSYEIALLTIGIGWAVGTSVRKGAGALAGRPYQVMAVALTWFALGGAYAGLMVNTLMNPDVAAVETEALDADAGPVVVPADGSAAPAADADAPGAGTDAFEAGVEGGGGEAEADGEVSAAGLGAAAVMGIAGIALMAVAAPVIVAVGSPLSGLITAFGLYQAWVQSRPEEAPLRPTITGPHTAGGEYAAPPPPAPL